MLTWIAGSMLSLWERQKGFQRGGSNAVRESGCPREDDDDWTVGVAYDCEALPHHERGREHQGKVERLRQDLCKREGCQLKCGSGAEFV